jgi:type IV secretion system protein VirD4
VFMDQTLARLTQIWPWLPSLLAWGPWVQMYQWWLMGTVGGLVGLVALMIGMVRRHDQDDSESYGTARFATPREILASATFDGAGIVAGRLHGHLLQLDPEEDVLVVGPKGTGKSSGVIIPTLRQWAQSIICFDLSGELVKMTARAREKIGPVYIFDPLNPKGDHYNLFDGIRWGVNEEIDVQRAVDHLSYIEPHTVRSEAGTFYRPWAQALLEAVILYIHHSRTQAHSVQGLLDFFSSADSQIPTLLRAMESYPNKKISTTATLILRNRADLIKNIFSSVFAWILPWNEHLLASVTGDTTIPIEALQYGSDPCTLYLRFSVEDLQGRLNRQARIMGDQIGARLCDREDPTTYDHRLLWIFDDLAEYGNYPLVLLTTAHRRKYGHAFLGACQSFGQLMERYGPNTGGLLSNCTTWVLFQPMERREADVIAGRLDDMTVTDTVERLTRTSWSQTSRSIGEQSHRRALMTPDEIMRLAGPDERQVLVCASGERPALIEQARWYECEERS